ncbi:MAG: hypothetical protein SFW67_17865 [Myxococcaceae bacterium]|nr:hypothetical protein [Myxococcaceae bacterium]
MGRHRPTAPVGDALIFGGLLNVFLVFFFRSSGNALALVFVAVLLVLLVLNELPRFRERGPLVRVALLSFSMTAFLMYLLPIVTGTLHRWQPVAAVAIGAVLTLALWRFLVWLTPDPTWTFRRAGLPGLVIQVGLLGLLVGDLVPPVPLALKHIGIYTSVKPAPDGAPMHVFLTWQPAEAWEVWRRDARTLVADAGQQVWVYARVFAPMAFDDEIVFVWERAEPDGWVALGPPQPEPLHGGMDEGFRVFAARPLTHAGDYRVRLLAEDGREIGRRAFTFAPGAPPRSQSGVD